jgi:uncharacterized protein with HEPN domain
MSLAEFQADERTIDAVLHNFEIIGEAADLKGSLRSLSPAAKTAGQNS